MWASTTPGNTFYIRVMQGTTEDNPGQPMITTGNRVKVGDGVGTVATVQLFTDYLTRLMRYVEFMKKVVPLHDDLFDFFYEALPGYEKVGYRQTLLGCWGAFQDPDVCDYRYQNMNKWGRAMFVTPGVVVDGKTVTNDLVDINLPVGERLGPGPDIGDVGVDAVW